MSAAIRTAGFIDGRQLHFGQRRCRLAAVAQRRDMRLVVKAADQVGNEVRLNQEAAGRRIALASTGRGAGQPAIRNAVALVPGNGDQVLGQAGELAGRALAVGAVRSFRGHVGDPSEILRGARRDDAVRVARAGDKAEVEKIGLCDPDTDFLAAIIVEGLDGQRIDVGAERVDDAVLDQATNFVGLLADAGLGEAGGETQLAGRGLGDAGAGGDREFRIVVKIDGPSGPHELAVIHSGRVPYIAVSGNVAGEENAGAFQIPNCRYGSVGHEALKLVGHHVHFGAPTAGKDLRSALRVSSTPAWSGLNLS